MSTEKLSQPKSWELGFIQQTHWGWETLSHSSEALLWRGYIGGYKGGYIGNFAKKQKKPNKPSWSEHPKTTVTCLVIQWLRLCTPNAGGTGLITGQGTRSHKLQLRVHTPQLKIPCAATKTCCSQINTQIYIFLNDYCYLKNISQVNKFSTFLCMGRCKNLDSLKSSLWHAP